VPTIVNVMGFSGDELALLVEALDQRDEAVAIELNVSCPNVKTGMVMGADPEELTRLLGRLRPLSAKSLIVKLTPNVSDVATVAKAAQDAGANALSLINTLRGMVFDPATGAPWLGATSGGVSGPSIRAIAVAQVTAVRQAVELPIIGMGGVQRGRDALDLMRAGANLVAIGTESFRDPAAGTRIAAELAEHLANSVI
jgi:dihydroorotate dehydrogenase (NAD+) catalytic subunit